MGGARMPGDAGHTMWGKGPSATSGTDGASLKAVLAAVCRTLEEQGYDPARQLAGYLVSGDPAYITGHRGARALIGRVQRDRLLEELVREYAAHAFPPGVQP